MATTTTTAATTSSAPKLAPSAPKPKPKPKAKAKAKAKATVAVVPATHGWPALAWLQQAPKLTGNYGYSTRQVIRGLYRPCGQKGGQPVVNALNAMAHMGLLKRMPPPVGSKCKHAFVLTAKGRKLALPLPAKQLLPTMPKNYVATGQLV